MWQKKSKGRKFKGTYERDKKGERIFVLTSHEKDKFIGRRIVFESWQAARGLGWVLKK